MHKTPKTIDSDKGVFNNANSLIMSDFPPDNLLSKLMHF